MTSIMGSLPGLPILYFPTLVHTLVHDFLFAVLDIDALLGGADSFA